MLSSARLIEGLLLFRCCDTKHGRINTYYWQLATQKDRQLGSCQSLAQSKADVARNQPQQHAAQWDLA